MAIASAAVSTFFRAQDQSEMISALGTIEADSLALSNGSLVRVGTVDAGLGGSGGVAQICSIGYELKWEAGRLYVMNQGGTTIRSVHHCGTDVPNGSHDETIGYLVGTRWVLDDGTIYVCSDSTESIAVWDLANPPSSGFSAPVQTFLDSQDEESMRTACGIPPLLDARVAIVTSPPTTDEYVLQLSGNPTRQRYVTLNGELGYDGNSYGTLTDYLLTETGEVTDIFTDNGEWSYDLSTDTLTNINPGYGGGVWIGGLPEGLATGNATVTSPNGSYEDYNNEYFTDNLVLQSPSVWSNGSWTLDTSSGYFLTHVDGGVWEASDTFAPYDPPPGGGGYPIRGTVGITEVLVPGTPGGFAFDTNTGICYHKLNGEWKRAGTLLELLNGSFVRQGTVDAGRGGAGGVAQICSIGYELKWEAGWLYVMEQGGTQIRAVMFTGTATPSDQENETKGFYAGSMWITDDWRVFRCSLSNTDGATWESAKITAGGLALTADAYVELTTNRDATDADNGKIIWSNGSQYILHIPNTLQLPWSCVLKNESANSIVVTLHESYTLVNPDGHNGTESVDGAYATIDFRGGTKVYLTGRTAFIAL